MARQPFGAIPAASRGAVAQGAPHLRDAINLDLAMRRVVLALLPCLAIGLYNTGFQINLGLEKLGPKATPGWRGGLLGGLGIGHDPSSLWANLAHGLVYFVPVLAVALLVGFFWESLFATLRKRPRSEGLVVIALLFALSLPPSVPLWQVALAISFAIVVGKEVFGGTGKNFLNPALVGLAFLYVAYPRDMVGETAWTVVDGFTAATSLRAAAEGGLQAIGWLGTTWMQTFVGLVPGPFGATSALASLLGAAYLIATRTASARIMVGIVVGAIVSVLLFNWLGGEADPFFELTWRWHLVLGSFAFGTVFLATDPVTAAMTDRGRWIYGLLIGAMIIVIRVANAAHPDGVMFAILIGNIFAPLIDHLVVRANIRRRERRGG